MARILLVDDDAASLSATRRALEGDGHAVTTAASGADAVGLAAQGGAFDLLVTDVQMPGMDGTALAGELRRGAPALPVVLVSAHPDDLARASSAVPGARVVAKPFTVDRIRSEVKAALG